MMFYYSFLSRVFEKNLRKYFYKIVNNDYNIILVNSRNIVNLKGIYIKLESKYVFFCWSLQVNELLNL